MPKKPQLNLHISPRDWARLEAVRRLRAGQTRSGYVRDAVLRAIDKEVAREDPDEIEALTQEILSERFGIRQEMEDFRSPTTREER